MILSETLDVMTERPGKLETYNIYSFIIPYPKGFTTKISYYTYTDTPPTY